VAVTQREWQLLEALATRCGRVVSRAELESLLLGHDGDLSSNSIEVHVSHLRR
jgi:two-component system OmpR family response regulator